MIIDLHINISETGVSRIAYLTQGGVCINLRIQRNFAREIFVGEISNFKNLAKYKIGENIYLADFQWKSRMSYNINHYIHGVDKVDYS